MPDVHQGTAIVFFERLYEVTRRQAMSVLADSALAGSAMTGLAPHWVLPTAWAQPAPQTLPTLPVRRRSL